MKKSADLILVLIALHNFAVDHDRGDDFDFGSFPAEISGDEEMDEVDEQIVNNQQRLATNESIFRRYFQNGRV